MLEVMYCEEELFDLPPPTLFIRGDAAGFEELAALISRMLADGQQRCLNDCAFVRVRGTHKDVVFQPFGRQVLLQVSEHQIMTDLAPDDWQGLISQLHGLAHSQSSRTYFVEVDNAVGEGNLVLES